MTGRLIGSDDGLSQIQQASDSLNANVQGAQKQATDSLTNYYSTFLQSNKYVSDQQQALAGAQLAEAQNNSTAQGLASLAQTGVQYLTSQKQYEDRLAIAQQNLANKVQIQRNKETQQQLKQAQENAAVDANAAIFQNTSDYEQGKLATFRDTQGNVNPIGINRYITEQLQVISKYPNLLPADRQKLIEHVYQVAEKQYAQVNTDLNTRIDKLRSGQADTAENALTLQVLPLVKTLGSLGVTEQAKPLQQQIDSYLTQFLQTDNGVRQEDKWAIVNRIQKQAIEQYGVKFAAFADSQSKARNAALAIPQLQQARAAYLTPGNPLYQNADAYNASRWAIKQKYGDFETAVAKPGEQERFVAEQQSVQKQLSDLAEQGSVTAGKAVQFSDGFSKLIAGNIAVNPDYAEYLRASPLRDNPSVRAGIALAERRQAWLKAQGDTNVGLASLGTDIQKLNLEDARTYTAVISHFIQRQQSGTPLDAGEQKAIDSIIGISTDNPALAAINQQILDKLLGRTKTEPDPQVLQQTLNILRPQIAQIKQALLEEQRLKQVQLQQSFDDVYRAGLAIPGDQINNYVQLNQRKLQDEINRAQQEILQTTQQPRAYGVQPNFNSASVFAPDIDANGRVTIAPRTKLASYDLNGKSIVLPVAAGVTGVAPSLNKGHGGGGYGADRDNHRHAGVDINLHPGQRAVSLVSGYAYVDSTTDPSGYGTFIDIIGDNGYKYRYAHQQAFVKTGDRITAGQAISTPNNSGHNRGAHLHFEVLPPGNSNDSNGKYVPKFGFANTIDPIAHLQQLSVNSSNVTKPRDGYDPHVRVNPEQRTSINAFFSGNGGAIQANLYQSIQGNKPPVPANTVHNNQRPVQSRMYSGKLGEDLTHGYDYNDPLGYAYLKNNPAVLRQLNVTAQKLGVPAAWIADIANNESSWNPQLNDQAHNKGLFQFGDDSFDGLSSERIRQMSAVDQIKLLERYYNENGWDKIKQKYGDNVNIGQFYAPLRFGNRNNKRQRVIDSADIANEYVDDYKTKYGSELLRLGKDAGRHYGVPGFRNPRARRSAAISNDFVAYCPVCNSLDASGSFVPHTHELEG